MIAIGLFVNAALLVGILLRKDVVVHASGGGGGVPVGNGDVNGDGRLDIADAIYLINHQFRGGPAPLAIECPPPVVKGLPTTGQTKCYDDAGAGIPCDSATCPGQDGSYATGCPSEGRFTDNGDGTVTDTCTGLMWQKDTADVNGDAQIGGADRLAWCEALSFCENLDFAGHEDWHLPNMRELQSIVDYGRFSPAIDSAFGALSAEYWSSTSYAGDPHNNWVVGFIDGFVFVGDFGGRDDRGYVRAVRDTQ